MTASRTYATPERVPREKQFPIRIVLPLTAEMLTHMDGVRGDAARVDFIRQAIERELKRRSRQK